MRGLDPRIHRFFVRWIAGSEPGNDVWRAQTGQFAVSRGCAISKPDSRGLDPRIHHQNNYLSSNGWIAGSRPRLSGLDLVDMAHGVDSSVFRAFANVRDTEGDPRH